MVMQTCIVGRLPVIMPPSYSTSLPPLCCNNNFSGIKTKNSAPVCHLLHQYLNHLLECNISVLADLVYKDFMLSLDASTTLQLDTNKLAINIILAMKVGAILLLVAISASYAAVFSGRNAGTFNLLLHHP